MGKKFHFIAVGGSVMHALAIALKKSGHQVTGSDDAIYGRAREALAAEDLLPPEEGWFPEKITDDLDTVILGMHARKDNPELQEAQKKGIAIQSFPDVITSESRNKQRVVVAGSHGKTTITAMIMHVFRELNIEFDYLVGAPVPGFESQVKLSDAPVIIIEGDEYLSSPLDPTPKFLKYDHHIGIISGIDWDHANVFPEEDEYIRQFEIFADATPKAGTLVYNAEDSEVARIGDKDREDVNKSPYTLPDHEVRDGRTLLKSGEKEVELSVFGRHNLLNLQAVRVLMDKFILTDEQFLEAIASFKGAGQRLEPLGNNRDIKAFLDFAHAPSKARATTEAVAEQYPERDLFAVLELHTFSSLDRNFVKRYSGSLDKAKEAIVYFGKDHKEIEGGQRVEPEDIIKAFGHSNLQVIGDPQELSARIESWPLEGNALLLMSSGRFGGLDPRKLIS